MELKPLRELIKEKSITKEQMDELEEFVNEIRIDKERVNLNISIILNELINQKKATIEELANVTGCSQQIIQNILDYLKDRTIKFNLKTESLYAISNQYNISMEKIFEMDLRKVYKAKVIEREGNFSDGSYTEKIEEELNELYAEGYELISSNIIYENNLLVILKNRFEE